MTEEITKIEQWIKEYVESAHAKGVVLGMSGGKDSLIVAKLCADAIGKQNVLGIIMPNGKMSDIDDAKRTCKLLGIDCKVINISKLYRDIIRKTRSVTKDISSISIYNTPPRLRMTILYSIAGSKNYLVANTSNLSEYQIGWTTKWGDNVGDFSPLSKYTKTEVCEIGHALSLPKELVDKIPSDGLCGSADEEKLDFSYDELDKFIRLGEIGQNQAKIQKMHNASAHKRNGVVRFENGKKDFFEK